MTISVILKHLQVIWGENTAQKPRKLPGIKRAQRIFEKGKPLETLLAVTLDH